MTVNGPLLTRPRPSAHTGLGPGGEITCGCRSCQGRSRSWPGRGTGLMWRSFSLNKTNDCLLQLFGQTHSRPRCRPPSIITLRGTTAITCSHGYSKYTPVLPFPLFFIFYFFLLLSSFFSLAAYLLLVTGRHGRLGAPGSRLTHATNNHK